MLLRKLIAAVRERLRDSLFDSGLDAIYVSLHSATAEKHVRRVLSEVDDERRARANVVSMFDHEEKGEFLYNRIEMAEALPRSVPALSVGAGCSNVDSLMINFDGESALCCNVFFANNGHGGLKDVSVEPLWRESRSIRKRIYLGVFDKPICRICNAGAVEAWSNSR